MVRWPWSRQSQRPPPPLSFPDRPKLAPQVETSTWTPPRDLSEVDEDWYSRSVFRRLHEVLTWSEAETLREVLDQAIPIVSPFVEAVAPFGVLAQTPSDYDGLDDGLWALYALSRVNDFLLLHFQSRPVGVDAHENYRADPGRLSMEDYRAAMAQLGFTPVQHRAYHPFFHEIVDVAFDPGLGDRVEIEREVWPGYMFEEMMFSRSGVAVRAGPEAGLTPFAARSNLYFTYQRRFRPTVDLSMGWGSNSQWSTHFRRDFLTGGRLLFNADGRHMLDETYEASVWREDRVNVREGDGLTLADRISLLRYRCLVLPREDSRELWTWDDRYIEDAPAEQSLPE